MLGSFGSSSHEAQEADTSPLHIHYHHHQIQQQGFTSPSIHMRQLLITCADLISRADFSAAHRLLTILFTSASQYGDSTERLVHQFTKALSLRLNRHPPTASITSILTTNINATNSTINYIPTIEPNESVLQSSYLSLNQVTPFIRFTQLTANQAILEAIQGQDAIHILDFDIMHGVQWPPLMQAIAERFPPPTLRITGTGSNLVNLRKTGDRLSKFAQSIGLKFQFHPLVLLQNDDPTSVPSALLLLPDETLAVNCVLYLHRLLNDRDRLRLFLRRIKAMNPKIVTLAEKEANHNHPVFMQRFVEALDHYSAVFDSLEATLPPNSHDRLAVEQVWFGREIRDIVAAEGQNRRERHERFGSWEMMLRSSGFNNVPLSGFALSQAKLLLRLHYPSEGYQLHILNDSFFLGWQNQPLFSISSWN